MIEPRIVPAEAKKSGAVYGTYTRGSFCRIGPAFTAQSALNIGQAAAGEMKLILSTGGTGNNDRGRVFPIDKLTFMSEDGDSSYDTLASGDRVMYFTEGEFATDCYDTSITVATELGTLLYTNTTGWLTVAGEPGGSGDAIAILVAVNTVGTSPHFNATALYTKNLITYRLL